MRCSWSSACGLSAARGARDALEALAAAVSEPISAIALRVCPQLPPTVAERIADNRAQTVADSVMYREALASAAKARGWSVHWYDRAHVARAAARVLGREDIDAFLNAMGRSVGPPWQAKHNACGSRGDCAERASRDSRPRRALSAVRVLNQSSPRGSRNSQLTSRSAACPPRP